MGEALTKTLVSPSFVVSELKSSIAYSIGLLGTSMLKIRCALVFWNLFGLEPLDSIVV